MPFFTFPASERIIVDAYHGTEKANLRSIMENGFAISTNADQHLGDGIYFYEGSKWLAQNWPKIRNKHANPNAKVAVLRCTINLRRCIDLVTEAHQNALASFRALVRFRVANGSFPEKNLGNITDPFIINLAAFAAKADTVRAEFRGGPKGVRIVIAVRTKEKILATNVESVDDD